MRRAFVILLVVLGIASTDITAKASTPLPRHCGILVSRAITSSWTGNPSRLFPAKCTIRMARAKDYLKFPTSLNPSTLPNFA